MPLSSLPSVDRLLRSETARSLVAERGRTLVIGAIRRVLAEARAAAHTAGNGAADINETALMERVRERVTAAAQPSMRTVFNLTGTVLHTNLGRALLPREAVEAIVRVALDAANVEFDLDRGTRGDRDDHVEAQLRRLTGAEAATIVNNNAAAVLLVLNTLAARKEVPTSRGELIEIGGSFRLPDVMARAGCRLREVGTTNRVHLRDYADAIGAKTGAVMKAHTSNYAIVGFTASVEERDLAALCRERGVPFVVDLGSGVLVDLRPFGLPYEPTVRATLAAGADVVTFSGDKLLGGPQAGIVAGRADLIDRIRRNPLKRALRVDKMTMAALEAVLALYEDPERLAERLPTLRLLTRTAADIRASAERLRPTVAAALENVATVTVVDCQSQIGAGALPIERIASAGLSIQPQGGKRGSGGMLNRIAGALRGLPTPVIGRIQDGALILDFRCLEDEPMFVDQLPHLQP